MLRGVTPPPLKFQAQLPEKYAHEVDCLGADVTVTAQGFSTTVITKSANLLPKIYQEVIVKQIASAGSNKGLILEAIRDVLPEQRDGAAYLLANMPTNHLKTMVFSFWFLIPAYLSCIYSIKMI